jgi:hypothetical protein
MRRREFIAGLSGAAAWPVVARAAGKRPRVGVLTLLSWLVINIDVPPNWTNISAMCVILT